MYVSRIVAAVVGAVLLLATAIAATAGFKADAEQRRMADADVRRAALRALTSELDGLVATSRQVSGLFVSSEDVSESEFRTFTAPMLRSTSASAFGWLPVVPRAQRAAWERTRGMRILEPDRAGRFVPAPPRAVYHPWQFMESSEPSATPLGLSTSWMPERRAALTAAGALDQPVATPVTRLVGSGRAGLLVYSPARDERGAVTGYAVGSFRMDQLVAAITSVLPNEAAFELRQAGTHVGGNGALGEDADDWSVEIAGQRWDVLTSSAPAGRISTGLIALVGGILLTALVLLTQAGLARRADRAALMATESEERFAHAFEHAPVGMALLDADGRHVRVNDAMARLVGRTRDELTGLGPEDVMPPREAQACRKLLSAFLRGDQTSFSGDAALLSADGRRVRAAVHITMLRRTDSGEPPILVHAVDVTEQRLAERRIRHLADHDPLTGLLNRRGFATALQSQIAHARRYGSAGALLILDLDGFKAVNDAKGHEAGDQLLVQVAAELGGCLRETDVLARLGGDEFAVILPRETLDEAAVVAAKITARLRDAAIGADGPDLPGVTASVGVAPFEGGEEEGDDVLRAADLAMYAAKAAGRDRHAVHGRHADVV